MEYTGGNFRKILALLRTTYESIDIRGVFALSIQENGIWRCPLLKIRFTNHSLKEIDKIYEKKFASLGKIDYPEFKIIFECRSIDKFDQTIKELNDMRVQLGGITAQPMGTHWQNITWPNDSVVTTAEAFMSENEINGYRHLIYFSRAWNIEDVLKNHCKINIEKFGISYSDINSYLDLPKIDRDIDLAVCFPIICKRIREKNHDMMKFEIHETFVNDSKVHANHRRNGSLIQKYDESVRKLVYSDNKIKTCSIPFFPEPIQENDIVSISIDHETLSPLLTTDIRGFEVDSAEVSNAISNGEISITNKVENQTDVKKVFIIHGHDRVSLYELDRILSKDFRLDTIILKYKPGEGRTLIEKFEEEAKVAGYAFVLITPDDIVQVDDKNYLQARPNVIFELGWFYGRLGRKKVCIIMKKGTKIHSDLDGISRIEFEDNIEDKFKELSIELRRAKLIE